MSAALAGGGTAYDAFEVQVLLDLSRSMQPSKIRDYGVNAYALTRCPWSTRSREDRSYGLGRCRRPCLYLPPRRCPDRACRRELLASRSPWLIGDPGRSTWLAGAPDCALVDVVDQL